MKKTIITAEQSPPPVGPYSHAVAAGPFVFLSGQVAQDASGQLLAGDIVVQTVQVIQNIKTVLAAAGLSLQDVVKTTVYLADMADFKEMNRTYAEFFTEAPPARTTIQVAGLPRGAAIEIEAIALKKA